MISAEIEDDPTIADDEFLLRRLWRGCIDPNDGTLTALAFLDGRSGSPSVNRAALTTREKVLSGWPWMGLAEVQARVPRANEHGVIAAPEPDDPSHALLIPSEALAVLKKRKEAARRIAKAARIVVPVPG